MLPTWYWIVSGILVVWGLIGCLACYTQMTMSAEKIAKLPEQQRDAWTTMPGFAKAAYVVAVLAGVGGAILLLLQNALALPLSVLSLAGILVQFGWFFFGYGGWKKHGPGGAIFPIVIALVCMGQIALACCAKAHGWIA